MIVQSHRLHPADAAECLRNQKHMTPSQKEMCIGSPHLVWVVKRRKYVPAAVRRAVIERDGCICVYCGRPAEPMHFDHRIPVSRGGDDSAANLAVSCADCNLGKGALTDQEWLG